jgi:hypothetical protein
VLGKLLNEFGILKLEGQPEVWKIDTFYYKTFSRTFKDLKQEEKAEAPAVPVKPDVRVAEPPPIVRQEIPDPPPVDETPAYTIPKTPVRVQKP